MQEYHRGRGFELMKGNGDKEPRLLPVIYHCFIAIVTHEQQMKRFKVVVKQVGDGKPYFWSIIPFWKRSSQFFSGNPEGD